MPVIEFRARLNVDQLIAAVAQLDPAEWVRFEQRWEDLRTQRAETDRPMWEQAAAYCLPPEVQKRIETLLTKGSAGTLTPAEEAELRVLSEEVDHRNLVKAEALLYLAKEKPIS